MHRSRAAGEQPRARSRAWLHWRTDRSLGIRSSAAYSTVTRRRQPGCPASVTTRSRRRCRCSELGVIERVIRTTSREQLLVRALLDDLARLQDEDEIGAAN